MGIAVLAIVAAGLAVAQNRMLTARLEELSAGHLAAPQASIPAPSILSSNLEVRLKACEAGSPGMGGVMTRVQLHFAKLYFAVEARNWDLAKFERQELEENLGAAAEVRPEERGVGIAGVIEAFKNTQLTAMREAIDVKDRTLFREAYRDSMVVCNTCHQTTGRPFIHIILPTNPPVSNQQWEPTP
jgi:hypothetical protein